MHSIASASSNMTIVRLCLLGLVTVALAAPLNEAKTKKKLMRKDQAGSGKAVELEVASRGAAISQHQRLHSEVTLASEPAVRSKPASHGASKQQQAGASKQQHAGASKQQHDGDDDSDDDGEEDDEGEDDEGYEEDEEEKEEKVEEAEKVVDSQAASAENAVNTSQVSCDGSDIDGGRAECMHANKCGDNENATWQIQCGYGSLKRVDNICVFKSEDAKLTADKCEELGETQRGNLFCRENELFMGCGDAANWAAVHDHHVQKIQNEGMRTEDADGEEEDDEGEEEEAYVGEGDGLAASLHSHQHLTEEELTAPIDIIDYFENLEKDKDLPYVEDPDHDKVCKTAGGHDFVHEGKNFSISVAVIDNAPAEHKKCNISSFIPSTTEQGEGITKAFEHGRLKLCAMYVATSPFCGINFYMTKDYHCYCSNGPGCAVVAETDACIYTLNEVNAVTGHAPTLEDLQERRNHEEALGEELKHEHELHPGEAESHVVGEGDD